MSSLIPRHERILQILQGEETVSVAELAGQLGVSAVTIRTDLAYLEGEQLLRRVRGGARRARPARFEAKTERDLDDRQEDKTRIAAAAAAMVHSGDTIILDGGTTTLALAQALPDSLHDVMIVTNSVEVALVLQGKKGLSVYLTGGKLRESSKNGSRSLVSPMATLLLQQINADIAFLCCAGIDVVRGFTNANIEEAEMKHAMMASARRTVVVADHSKVGHIGVSRIAGLTDVSLLVTSAGVSGKVQDEMEAAGLKIVIA